MKKKQLFMSIKLSENTEIEHLQSTKYYDILSEVCACFIKNPLLWVQAFIPLNSILIFML